LLKLLIIDELGFVPLSKIGAELRPEQELAALREPLAGLKPQFFTLEYGFRK
jgi:hypothetical protein